jgi:hypothetical protein
VAENGVLKCSEVSELATDFMEGQLPVRRWLAVRLHLALCDMCRKYLDQLRKVRRLLSLRPLDGPSDAEERDLLVALAQNPPHPGDQQPP